MQRFYKEQNEESMDMSDIVLKEHSIKKMMEQIEEARQTKLPEYFNVEPHLRREWFTRMENNERERWEIKLRARFTLHLEGYWLRELKNEPQEAKLPTEVRIERMWRRLRVELNNFYHQTHYELVGGHRKYEDEFEIPQVVHYHFKNQFFSKPGIKTVMDKISAPLNEMIPMQYIPNFLDGRGSLEQEYIMKHVINRWDESLIIFAHDMKKAKARLDARGGNWRHTLGGLIKDHRNLWRENMARWRDNDGSIEETLLPEHLQRENREASPILRVEELDEGERNLVKRWRKDVPESEIALGDQKFANDPLRRCRTDVSEILEEVERERASIESSSSRMPPPMKSYKEEKPPLTVDMADQNLQQVDISGHADLTKEQKEHLATMLLQFRDEMIKAMVKAEVEDRKRCRRAKGLYEENDQLLLITVCANRWERQYDYWTTTGRNQALKSLRDDGFIHDPLEAEIDQYAAEQNESESEDIDKYLQEYDVQAAQATLDEQGLRFTDEQIAAITDPFGLIDLTLLTGDSSGAATSSAARPEEPIQPTEQEPSQIAASPEQETELPRQQEIQEEEPKVADTTMELAETEQQPEIGQLLLTTTEPTKEQEVPAAQEIVQVETERAETSRQVHFNSERAIVIWRAPDPESTEEEESESSKSEQSEDSDHYETASMNLEGSSSGSSSDSDNSQRVINTHQEEDEEEDEVREKWSNEIWYLQMQGIDPETHLFIDPEEEPRAQSEVDEDDIHPSWYMRPVQVQQAEIQQPAVEEQLAEEIQQEEGGEAEIPMPEPPQHNEMEIEPIEQEMQPEQPQESFESNHQEMAAGEPVEADNENEGNQNRESAGSASEKPDSYWEERGARGRQGKEIAGNPQVPDLSNEEEINRRFQGDRTKAEKYMKYKDRKIKPDKGFEQRLLGHSHIVYLKETHLWNEFMRHDRQKGYGDMTKEFFANINGRERKSWVRGQVIDFSATALNQFLQTPDQPSEISFEQVNRDKCKGHERERMRSIATEFCGEDPTNGTKLTFPTKKLKPEFAPAFDFYTSKIRPTSHTHATSGVVIYSLARLWKGKMINVGELISDTIMSRETDKRSPPLGLCYPNLIRRLCERAGVDMTQFRAEDAIEIDPPIPLPRNQLNQPLRFNLDDPLDEPTDVATSVAPQPATTRPTKRRKTRKETEVGTSKQQGRNEQAEEEHVDPAVGRQEETSQMRRKEKQTTQPTRSYHVTQGEPAQTSQSMAETIKTILESQQELFNRQMELQEKDMEIRRMEAERKTKEAEQHIKEAELRMEIERNRAEEMKEMMQAVKALADSIKSLKTPTKGDTEAPGPSDKGTGGGETQ